MKKKHLKIKCIISVKVSFDDLFFIYIKMTILHSCISENNGLYMAVNPDEYRRIVRPS